jgi:hypothetical protein
MLHRSIEAQSAPQSRAIHAQVLMIIGGWRLAAAKKQLSHTLQFYQSFVSSRPKTTLTAVTVDDEGIKGYRDEALKNRRGFMQKT